MTSRVSSSSCSSSPSTEPTLPTEEPTNKRRKIRRTRDGCLTCRKRRKLCDLDRPSCKACVRLKLTCQWHAEHDDLPRPARLPEYRPVQHRSPHAFLTDTLTDTLPPAVPNPGDRNGISETDFISSQEGVYTFSHQHPPVQASAVSNDTRIASATANISYQFPPSSSRFDPSGSGSRLPMTGEMEMSFDELWAAGCLSLPSTQTIDPFQSLSNLLYNNAQPAPTLNPTNITQASLSPPARNQPTEHAQLLAHYQASLSSLLSCTGSSESAPSAFVAFTKLAEASSSSEAGQGLHLGILAWAGVHLVNQGQSMYEAVSERLGAKSTRIVMAKLEEWKSNQGDSLTETERMTLLAGDLMIIQFKICRGDVWGYEKPMFYLRLLSSSLYPVNNPGAAPNSMLFSFFENLVYHDLLSSSAYSNSPLVPHAVLQTYSASSSDFLHTLTGVCFPLFCKMHRIASLASQRRKEGRIQTHTMADASWTDEQLYDLVTAADEVEQQLGQEKSQMEALIRNKPSLSSHRFLHEAFRIASLMTLRSFVFCEPPSTFRIRLLVRQSLSLLEEMHEKGLPGFCSAHWVLFVTALNCKNATPSQDSDNSRQSDCQRIERLYDVMIRTFPFGNLTRSRKVFREVWSQNEGGRIFVDWVDIVNDFDWELFVV